MDMVNNHSAITKTKKSTLVQNYQLNYKLYSNFSSFSINVLLCWDPPGGLLKWQALGQ